MDGYARQAMEALRADLIGQVTELLAEVREEVTRRGRP